MIDYKKIIQKAFSSIGKSLEWTDPYDRLMSIPGLANCGWLPPYAAECDGNTYLFKPYNKEVCTDTEFLMKDIGRAHNLIKAVTTVYPGVRFFLVVQEYDDLTQFASLDGIDEFGAILATPDSPSLNYSIKEALNRDQRLLTPVLESLKTIQNIAQPFRDIIISFATSYPDYGNGEEETRIKQFVENLLKADPRLQLSLDPVVFMRHNENMLGAAGWSVRDHYFHAVNTLLLGYLIIDGSYDRFSILSTKLGSQISSEILWLLTALFHDVGYVVANEAKISQPAYGMTLENDSAALESACRQKRLGLWNNSPFRDATKPIAALFEHLQSGVDHDWRYDGFARPDPPPYFTEALKKAFVDHAAHGAAGALNLGLSSRKGLLNTSDTVDREFAYQHCYLAAIGILLHDQRARQCLRDCNINSLPAEQFWFGLLLTYIDILQNDKRERLTDCHLPIIYEGIAESAKGISVRLRSDALSEEVKCALTQELQEAMEFFTMNGITLILPDALAA